MSERIYLSAHTEQLPNYPAYVSIVLDTDSDKVNIIVRGPATPEGAEGPSGYIKLEPQRFIEMVTEALSRLSTFKGAK